jgi:hypothetical protein
MEVGVVISCREVSTLISSEALRNQSLRRRLAAHVHLMMCGACRGFERQIKAMQRAARTAAGNFDREADGLERRVADAMRRHHGR